MVIDWNEKGKQSRATFRVSAGVTWWVIETLTEVENSGGTVEYMWGARGLCGTQV